MSSMKEKNIYKSIIKDVIIASGGEITDECFNKLKLLFSKYNLALSMEEMTEEDYNESV
jgi:hypothetical protein